MTREQSIMWLRKQLRWSSDGLTFCWGLLAFFWIAIFIAHVIFIPEPFHFESTLVVCLFCSIAGLIRGFQLAKLRKTLNVLLGESWDK
jgi:type II secretory pathway component PulF